MNKYTKITKERLDECLSKIGWSTKHHGCNFYYVYNQHNKATNFCFRAKNKKCLIYEIKYEGSFGEGQGCGNGGSCVFILSGCILLVEEECVSIQTKSVKDCKQPAFLSFYNFKNTK